MSKFALSIDLLSKADLTIIINVFIEEIQEFGYSICNKVHGIR